MTLARYSFGMCVLGVALVPVAVAARRARRWLLPDWSGADAFLVESIVFLALLLAVCQVLGTVGLFRLWAVVAGCVLAAGAVIASVRLGTPAVAVAATEEPSLRSGGGYDERTLPIAIALVMVVVGLWWLRAAHMSRGIVDYDSMSYHLPFAVRFFQQGHTLSLFYLNPGEATAFYPANSELLVAFFMLPFRRDIIAPLLNFGWLALALLAAWCMGRPRGVADVTLASAAVFATFPTMLLYDAGTASNDIAAIALLLAAIALLVRGNGRLGAIAVAGAAAGLALATKLTVAVPVVVLTIGIIVIARAGQRWRTAAVWAAPLALTGGFWYARNLAIIGNPVPSLHIGIGGWKLPAPRFSLIDKVSSSVAHFIGDGQIWRKYFLPGLRGSLGPLWILPFALAAAGFILALRNKDHLLRVLGVVGIASLVAYIFTPTTAGGVRGVPLWFETNARYVIPAISIGLLLLALTLSNSRPFMRGLLVTAIVVSVAAQRQWAGAAFVLVIAGAVSVASRTVVDMARRAPRRRLRAVAVFALIGLLGVGFFVQRQYLDRRYVNALTTLSPSRDAFYAWARTVSHARIGFSGDGRGYPLSGLDLSNYVQYIGVHGPNGSFEAVTNCREWRRIINAGHYDYIVVYAIPLDNGKNVEADWTRGSAAQQLLRAKRSRVFKLVAPLDPNQCPAGT
jgi:hypothetical protein